MKKIFTWVLIAFVSFVFIQSLFFKFSGSEQTDIIFNTVGQWMADIGMPAFIANTFKSIGGYVIGGVELIAALLLIRPKSRIYGALLGLGVMAGAIFFHLFTPLGVDRVVDAAGNTDGGELFFMACAVFVSLLIILFTSCKSSKR